MEGEVSDKENKQEEEETSVGIVKKKRKVSMNRQNVRKRMRKLQVVHEDSEEDEEDGQHSLYSAAIKRPTGSVATIISEWISRFETNPEEGGKELLNLVFHSCGAESVSLEAQDSLAELNIEEIQTAMVDDLETHAIVNMKQMKKVHVAMSEFWKRLMVDFCTRTDCSSELLDQLLEVFTALTNSKIRVIRTAATIAVYSTAKAFISVMKDIRQKLQTNQRLNQNEKRARQLDKDQAFYQGKHDQLHDFVLQIFKDVICHRYRDVVDELRALSIETLGVFVTDYPQEFQTDKYFKYFGWLFE